MSPQKEVEWLVAILGYEGVRGQHVFRFGSLYLYLPPFLYSSRPVTLWGSEYLFKGWPLLTAYLYHKRKSELQGPAFVRMFPYLWDSCLHTNAVCICRPRLDPFLLVKFDAICVCQGGGHYFIFIGTWGITPVWIFANQIRSGCLLILALIQIHNECTVTQVQMMSVFIYCSALIKRRVV